jgi:hypothetical protein
MSVSNYVYELPGANTAWNPLANWTTTNCSVKTLYGLELTGQSFFYYFGYELAVTMYVEWTSMRAE